MVSSSTDPPAASFWPRGAYDPIVVPHPSLRQHTQSISTSAPTARPVTPTHVRDGSRSGNQAA